MNFLETHCYQEKIATSDGASGNGGASDNLMMCVEYMSTHAVVHLRKAVPRRPCVHDWVHGGNYLR